jgi:imidazolonepropionase-like amidohydrolase
MKEALLVAPLLVAGVSAGLVSPEEAPPAPAPTPDPAPEVEPAEPPYGPSLVQIRAKVVDLGGGERIENGVVLMEDGKIRTAGQGIELDDRFPIVEYDGWLTPGMIACFSDAGLQGERWDSTRSILPEARIADGLDRDHSDLAKACAAGITSLVIAPSRSNVVGGVTAVVKTGTGRVLERNAHLGISLTSTALTANGTTREPTSFPGAIAALDGLLAEPEGVFAEVQGGRMPVLIEAWTRHEIDRAARFAMRHNLSGAIRGASLAGELSGLLKESGLGVVLGPYAEGGTMRTLSTARKLAEAGVPFAFGLESPRNSPERLRLNACQAISEGLDAGAAWSALTSDAAKLAGVASHVGSLQRGMDADFVLWSGPPTSLTSRVLAVYVDGQLVHSSSNHGDAE